MKTSLTAYDKPDTGFDSILHLTENKFCFYSLQYKNLLADVVLHGGKIGFHLPLKMQVLDEYIEKLINKVAEKNILLFAYIIEERLVGSMQLIPEPFEDAAHLMFVSKMIVSPQYRNRGIASRLVAFGTLFSQLRGARLLCLNTCSDSFTVDFYKKCGFKISGTIPGYIINSNGSFTDVTSMYKEI